MKKIKDKIIKTDKEFYFCIENTVYNVEIVPQSVLKEVAINEGDGYYFGQTHFAKNTIYLDKDLSYDRLIKTLIHEVMHVYIREYVTTMDRSYEENEVCDLIANSWSIVEYVKDSFEKWYSENYVSEDEE